MVILWNKIKYVLRQTSRYFVSKRISGYLRRYYEFERIETMFDIKIFLRLIINDTYHCKDRSILNMFNFKLKPRKHLSVTMGE